MVFTCKILAPVLKDCCSKCYKIFAENSTRLLFGALQSKVLEPSKIFVSAVKISLKPLYDLLCWDCTQHWVTCCFLVLTSRQTIVFQFTSPPTNVSFTHALSSYLPRTLTQFIWKLLTACVSVLFACVQCNYCLNGWSRKLLQTRYITSAILTMGISSMGISSMGISGCHCKFLAWRFFRLLALLSCCRNGLCPHTLAL